MRLDGHRESDNVEDRRGEGGGGGGGFGFGGGTVGIGGLVVALLASWLFGVSPSTILNLLSGGGGAPQVQQGPAPAPPASDRQASFVRKILADTEDTWSQLFREQGATYVAPKLDLFTGRIATACGTGRSASGPFYCPGDQKVYIDLTFYRLLQERFHAPGEFAQAYVIAHEVGHHVQNLLGISDKVDNARQHASESQANALSVRLELQADCFAGVWAYHANQARLLEQGDVEAGLNAASAIGDDTLQRETQGTVVPDSFTHGTSAQRVRWFSRGIQSGKVEQCDTFGARQL